MTRRLKEAAENINDLMTQMIGLVVCTAMSLTWFTASPVWIIWAYWHTRRR